MELQEAFRKAISQYYKGKQPTSTKSLGKRLKYDKKYFDKFEQAKFGDIPGVEEEEDGV